MTRYFGHMYTAPMYFDMEKADTPAGAPCYWCREPILAADDGLIADGLNIEALLADGTHGRPYHRACFMRQLIGSLAHVEGRCSCCASESTESDPPELSLRQAAEAAFAKWLELNEPRW